MQAQSALAAATEFGGFSLEEVAEITDDEVREYFSIDSMQRMFPGDDCHDCGGYSLEDCADAIIEELEELRNANESLGIETAVAAANDLTELYCPWAELEPWHYVIESQAGVMNRNHSDWDESNWINSGVYAYFVGITGCIPPTGEVLSIPAEDLNTLSLALSSMNTAYFITDNGMLDT